MAAEALFGTWVPRALCSGQPEFGAEDLPALGLTLVSISGHLNPHLDKSELGSNPLNAGGQIQLRPLLSLHSSLQTIPGFCVLLHPTISFGVTLIILASIISIIGRAFFSFFQLEA